MIRCAVGASLFSESAEATPVPEVTGVEEGGMEESTGGALTVFVLVRSGAPLLLNDLGLGEGSKSLVSGISQPQIVGLR